MNNEIIRYLNDLRQENSSNKQKVIAYSKIISIIKTLNYEIILETDLKNIKGIGTKTQEKIRNFLTNNKNSNNNSESIFYNELMTVTGIGHVKANTIIEKGHTSMNDNFSELLNDKQKIAIKYYKTDSIRIPRQEIYEHYDLIKLKLLPIKDIKFKIVGSYRRNKSDSGDIDLIITHPTCSILNKAIDALGNYLKDYFAYGDKKYMGWCQLDKYDTPRRIDILFTKSNEYPFALLYFTGSNNFNKSLRSILLKNGMRLNEYGLYNVGKTLEKVEYDFNDEKDIFEYLKLDYLEPCDREPKNIIFN